MIEIQRMSCLEALEAVSLRIDDDLKGDDLLRLRAHLSDCADCRTAERLMRADADERRRLFERCIESAPPCPIGRFRWKASPTPWKRIAAGIALLILAATFVLVNSLTAKPAAAAQILGVAAGNWLGHDDAELRLGVELAMTGSPEPLERVELEVFITHEGRLLLREVRDPGEPAAISGFDGTAAWSYDPQRSVVRIATGDMQPLRFEQPAFSLEIGGNIQQTVRYLTQDLVRDLRELAATSEADVDVRREGDGQLVYSIAIESEEEGWPTGTTQALVTVNPRQQRIVRMRVETIVAGLLVMTADLQTVRIDAGLAPAFFEPAAHVPPGAAVERLDR